LRATLIVVPLALISACAVYDPAPGPTAYAAPAPGYYAYPPGYYAYGSPYAYYGPDVYVGFGGGWHGGYDRWH